MSRRFTLTIDMDNAAFEDAGEGTEVARILRDLATRIQGEARLPHSLGIRDLNGNGVGNAKVDDPGDDYNETIRQLAVEKYSSSDIDIDGDAVVSVGDDGAYVAAWVFVDKAIIPDWDQDDEGGDES